MTPLQRRILRARTRRGAAVFVVVLVVMLLTALGVFAVKSATLSNAASGYNRQASQVHYITDFALAAQIAEVKHNPHETHKLMTDYVPDPTDATVSHCAAMSTLLKPTCRIVSYRDLEDELGDPNASGKSLLEPAAPPMGGSLGVNDLDADMRIELSDLHMATPPAGFEQGGGADATQQQSFAYVTISATGLVRPRQSVANTWDLRSATAATTEIGRAHIKIGPLLLQQ